jgi:hypothetical protein
MTDQPSSQLDTQPLVPSPPEAVPSAMPTPTGAARPGARWVNVALAVAVAIAIGGVGFAAGRMTAPASAIGAGNGRFFGNGTVPGGGYFPGRFGNGTGADAGRGFLGAGGASIEGTVDSVTSDTLTLKLPSGQTIQVSLGGSTTYHSQAAASASDVAPGSDVIVRIQINRGQGSTSPSAADVTIVP